VNLNKANSSNEKRKIYGRENYEITQLDVRFYAIRFDWLRGRVAAGHDNDNCDAGSDDHGSRGGD